MTLSFPPLLTDRFALIVRALHEAVAARIRCPPVTAEIIVHICARLRRIAADFERLAGQIRAGTFARRPAGRRLAGGKGSRRGASVVLLHWNLGLPPWQPAWLHRIAPGDAGVWTEALRNLISDPGMAALLAAVPRMRRILRPLCFMLGVETRLLTPRMSASADADACAGAGAAGTDGEPAPVQTATHVGTACATIAPRDSPPVTMVRIPDMPGAIFRPA